MAMQLQEGSVVSVNCAKCGKETFKVTVIQGTQRIRCTEYPGYVTVVSVQKSDKGDVHIETYSEHA